MTQPTPQDAAAIAAAKDELDQLAGQARTRLEKQAAELRPRQKYHDERIAHWGGMVKQLAPHAAHPEGGFLLRTTQLYVELHTALKQLVTYELAAHEHNLKLLPEGATTPVGPIPFRKAQDELGFHEPRLRSDAALVQILWRASRDGIDLVLRAAGKAPEKPGDGADAEAVRRSGVEDLSLANLVESLGEELEEVRGLLGWVEAAFAGFDKLTPDAKRQILQDGRWAEVGAVIEKLKRLHARVGGYPALTKWFPRPEQVDLPFGPPAEFGPAGTTAAATKGQDNVALNRGPSSKFKLGQGPGFKK